MCVKTVEGKEDSIRNELNHKTVTHVSRWSTTVIHLTIRRQSFDRRPEMANSDPIGIKKHQ